MDDTHVDELEQLGVGDVPVWDGPTAVAEMPRLGAVLDERRGDYRPFSFGPAGIPEGFVEIPAGGFFPPDHPAYDTPGVQSWARPDHSPGDPIYVPNYNTVLPVGDEPASPWAEADRHIPTEPLLPHRPGVNVEIRSAFRSPEDQDRINDGYRNERDAKYRAYLIRTEDGEDPEEVRKALGLERWEIRVMSRQEAQDELGFDWGRDDEKQPREWSYWQLGAFLGLAAVLVAQLALLFTDERGIAATFTGLVCGWALALVLAQTWHRYDIGRQLLAVAVDLGVVQHPEGD